MYLKGVYGEAYQQPAFSKCLYTVTQCLHYKYRTLHLEYKIKVVHIGKVCMNDFICAGVDAGASMCMHDFIHVLVRF